MRERRRRYGIIFIIAALMIFSAISISVFTAQAQASNVTTISRGFEPKLLRDGTFIGFANENMKIWVTIGLKWKNENSLDLFLEEVNNPSSSNYGKYLSYEKFKEKYAPDKIAYKQLLNWIKDHNVHIEYTYDLRNAIVIHDTVGKIGNLLGIKFGYFKSNNPNYKKEYFAAMSKPKVPTYLKPYISGINGLNNATQFKLHYYTASSGINYLSGADAAKMYQVYQLYNNTPDGSASTQHIFATGLRVATVLWEGADSWGNQYAPFNPDAVNYYYQHVIPTWIQNLGVMSTVHYYGTSGTVEPGSNTDGSVSTENELDLEMVGTLAPGVDAFCVYGPGSGQSPSESNFPDNEYNYILNTLAAESSPILVAVSNSWGGGDYQESSTTMNDVKALEAMGVTVMASSGDDGDTTSPSEPSTAAYDTYGFLAVGGTTPIPNGEDHTTLDDYATMGYNTNLANPRSSEIVWYDASSTMSNGDHWGTQSGISSAYSEPSWQSNYIGSYNGRVTADVSAMGNHTLIYVSSSSGTQWSSVAGTSVACPVIAGMVAMMDAYIGTQYHISNNGLGFLNPTIYKLGYDYYHNGKYSSSPPYFDVTQGSTGGGGSATTGWDQVSGWGVINAWNFIHDIGFTITSSSTSASINAGDSASYTLNIAFPYDWTTDVGHFQISGLPSGSSVSYSSSYVHPAGNGASSSLTLTIQTSSNTPDGTYTLTFTAYTYNHTTGHWGNLTNSIQLTLTVGNGGSNPTAPSAPQNLQANAGNGYVLLSWQTPSSNGGASITEYKIYRGTSSGSESYLAETSSLSYNDTSVTNGQTYYYYVTAVNSAGESQPSNEVSATPQAPAPQPSTTKILLVDDDGGQNYQSYFTQALDADGYQYDVWDVSSSGSPSASTLENYNVVIWTTGATWSNTLTSTDQSNLETFLNNGGALYLSSQDFLWDISGGYDGSISNTFINNYLGVSSVSNDVKYTSVSGVPGTFVESFSSVSLSNYPFTNYDDEINLNSNGNSLFINSQDNKITGDYVQTNTYKTVFTAFSFEAVENTDSSTGNALLKAIVDWLSGSSSGGSNPTAPSAPQNLQATAGNGYVKLTWDAPSNNGGASISEYKIYRGTSSGGESYLAETSSLSYNDTSVTNGQTYYYYVTAVNSAGESQPSNEVSATPQAPAPQPSTTKILLVDDDGGQNYQSYFTQALDADGYQYDVWDVSSSGSPSASTLENYNVVIWTTGATWSNTLTSTDQSNLETFLNNGGALYLSSQDFLYDLTGGWDESISNTFVTDYLGVDYVANDVSYTNVAGVSGTFAASFTSISLSNYPFTNYDDELGLSSSGHALFYNTADDYVTGDYVQTNTYKTVFTAFSFEAVENTDSSTGNALLKAIVDWLSGESTDLQININIPHPFIQTHTTLPEIYIPTDIPQIAEIPRKL